MRTEALEGGFKLFDSENHNNERLLKSFQIPDEARRERPKLVPAQGSKRAKRFEGALL